MDTTTERGNAERLTCSVEEAARMLGVSRATGYKLAADGTLPVIRIRRRVLVNVAALRAQITDGTFGGAA